MTNTAPQAVGIRLNGTTVTAGATVYTPPLTKLYAGGAGNVTLVMAQTGTVTVPMIAGGSLSDVAIAQVTTSTATGLTGFW